MKKIFIITMCCCLFLITGCFKKDNLENITIYTTAYPIEYITNQLYGSHSIIKSIYPDGIDISKYELTNKQIKEFSKGNLYIFNGLSNEKSYIQPMFKKNKDLMIIDATGSMDSNLSDELWLNPSNFLMISLNIKNGLLKYINNHYLSKEIEEKYEDLKVNISNIDAKLKLLSENNPNTTLIVDSDKLKFLENYGFRVISLEENDNLTDKVKTDALSLLKSKDCEYIFTLDEDNINKTVNSIKSATNAKILELNNLSTITDEQRASKEDYITLITENIEKLKEEVYD